MASVTLDWETIKKWRIAIVSVAGLFGTLVVFLWNLAVTIDARYEYKTLSDQRWYKNQEAILTLQLEVYHTKIEEHGPLSHQDQIQYNLLIKQLEWVNEQTTESLGEGPLRITNE